MTLSRLFFNVSLSIMFMLMALMSAPSFAQIKEGVDYQVLSRPQVAPKDRVEVIEFFSYGCIHCFDLEKVLVQWEKNLPSDVVFRREHVVWQKNMEVLASLFHTLKATGDLERLHAPVFHAVLKERRDIRNEAVLTQWLTSQRVDVNKFMQMKQSFSVNNAVLRATKITRDYQVEGTPMMVVGGRYAVLPNDAKRVLEVVNALIVKVRAENKKSS